MYLSKRDRELIWRLLDKELMNTEQFIEQLIQRLQDETFGPHTNILQADLQVAKEGLEDIERLTTKLLMPHK